MLHKKNDYLSELEFSGQRFTQNDIAYLMSGIQPNGTLRKLILPRNGINSIESITLICLNLQKNQTVEYLDLSNNGISDSSADSLRELIKSNPFLNTIKLDNNLISQTSFSVSLCENTTLTHFSLSYNPLTFENFISMLEMLSINLSLKFLGLKGIKFSGSASIKENHSGVLSKQEAIILKLSNSLRYSSISSLSIDLDPKAILQLKELEKTLLKYNSSLVSIYSDTINWKAQQQGPLLGIQKALRANSWMIKNEEQEEEIPIGLENIILSKKYSHKDSKKFNEDLENDEKIFSFKSRSSEIEFYISPAATSSDSNGSSPQLSEIKGIESYKKSDNSLEIEFQEKMIEVCENIGCKIQGFQEEIAGQVEILREKIQDLDGVIKEESLCDESYVISKINDIDRKNKLNQKMIDVVNNEILELKNIIYKDFEEQLKDVRSQIAEYNYASFEKNREKILYEANDIIKKCKDIKTGQGLFKGTTKTSRKKCENSRFITTSSRLEKKAKFSTKNFPSFTDSFVISTSYEKKNWDHNKKPEFNTMSSPFTNTTKSFYSPEDSPSRYLYEKLVRKGLKFAPRSSSAYRSLKYTLHQ